MPHVSSLCSVSASLQAVPKQLQQGLHLEFDLICRSITMLRSLAGRRRRQQHAVLNLQLLRWSFFQIYYCQRDCAT